MSLEQYKKKRNFEATPEPVSATSKTEGRHIFVVQRHKASRLHYDFRLEMDGVLKSWAVPKGPSLNPADKRLAMMVEDHPIDYANFAGVIPEGNYGAGIVEIWDKGTYELAPEQKGSGVHGIHSGSVKVILKGKKLKGQFALVKLKNAEDNAWLLIKDRDRFAVNEPYSSEDDTPASSPINKALGAKKTVAEKKSAPKKKEPKPDKPSGSLQLTLTHTDKIYWPGEGITKGDLLNYYNDIAPYMLPYLKQRPQNMNRMPNGITGQSFYQKEAGDIAPPWAETVRIFSESNNKDIDYLVCNNRDTLLYMANLGCIEINPWNATVKHIDKPDYLILDLDPSDKNSFDDVIEVAKVIHGIADAAGAATYPKTSGSTGIHIYFPLGAKYSFDECRLFAELMANLAVQQLPDVATVERTISQRHDKLYVDFLQNRTGQTLAAAYSVRPKPGATVSMPLDWKEVKKGLHPSQFTIANALKRVQKKGDLFGPVLGKGINMKACLKRLEAM